MNAWWTSPENAWQLAGWTMLHFLWIGAGVAAVGAVVRAALRRASPKLRYAASLTTLVMLAVAPIAIAVWLASNGPEFRRNSATVGEFLRNSQSEALSDEAAAPIELAVAPLPFASDPSGPLAPPPDARVGIPTPSPAAPRPLFDPTGFGNSESLLHQAVELLPWAWLVGAPLTFAWLTAGLVGSRRLQRASSPLVDGPIAEACRRLQQALGVTRRVALAVCEGLAQPVLVGIVKPTILLPAAAVTGWTPEELEMALVHELAHVRRWDNLVNFLQRIVESLLFFHPAVWLVSRQVRRDREECCDAIVVSQTRQPEAYATLLVSIATKLRARPAAALAVASAMANHALAGRVRRILKLEDQPMWVSRRWLAALLAIALGLTTAVYGVAVAEPAADDEAKAAGTDDEAADDESADSAPRKLTPEQREELHGLAEPGDVPAAVFVFPATPEEISRRVDELNWLGHNVRIDNGDGFTVLFIKDLDPSTFRRPHRLVPYDVIIVRVLGALADHPLDDAYVIEEEGTIALGPAYGRVAVDGLTVLEAEAAITKHLSEVLTEPVVQVTLAAGQQRLERMDGPAREADESSTLTSVRGDDTAEDRGDAEFELTRLEADIRLCQTQLVRIESDLTSIEVLKARALQWARGEGALDEAVEEALERDPTIVDFKQQIAALDDKIAKLLDESNDQNRPEFATLEVDRESISEAMNAYRNHIEPEIRERLARIPNEALRAAIAEYQVRYEALMKEKAEVEQRLTALWDRVEEFSVGVADESTGDEESLRAELEDYLQQLRALEREISELEIPTMPLDPDASADRVQQALENDPTLQLYQQQVFALQQQIQALQATSRGGQNAQLRQLQAALAETEAQMEQYRAEAEEEGRERSDLFDDKAWRVLIAEYEIKLDRLLKQRAELQRKIAELEERLQDLGAHAATEADDSDAGGGVAQFSSDELNEDAQAGHVTASKDGPLQGVVGQTALFRITVRNDGQLPLTDVEVFDEYPPGLLRVEPPTGDSNSQVADGLIRRVIPRLEVGQTHTFEVECQCVQAARPVLPAPLVRVRATTDPPTAIVETFDEHPLEILSPPVEVTPTATDDAFDDSQLAAAGGDPPAGGEDAASEEERLTAELQSLLAQVRIIAQEIGKLEIPRIPLDPGAGSAVDADPTLQLYREQLFQLAQQIQALAAESRNPRSAQLLQLQKAYAQTERQMEAYRDEAEEEADERLVDWPDEESERAKIAEYNAQVQSLVKRWGQLQSQIREIEERLREMEADDLDSSAATDDVFDPQQEAGGGDAPARGEGEDPVDANSSAAQAEEHASAKDYYDAGMTLLAVDQYRGAIKAFNQAIAVDATFADAHIGKGDALKGLGYYPEAAQSYSRALEIDSRLSAAYTGRGACFMKMTLPDYDLAANDFQSALDIDRDNVVALSSLGRIELLDDSDPQRAVRLLSEALQLDGDDAAILRMRAKAYFLAGQNDLAEDDALMAAKLDPENPENDVLLNWDDARRQAEEEARYAEEARRQAEEEGRYRAESEDDSDDYRYDGKTFDEWRTLWRRELKTERRIDAIVALAAFGRRAYPQEAAEAILDVAGEYDFTHDVDGPESDLKKSVVRAFSYGGVNGIAPAVWLPILVERVRESDGAEQRRWRDLLSALLMAWGHASPEHVGTMMELAEDEAVGVQEGAVYVLARNARDLSDPELVRILRASLTGARPSIRVLERLGFRELDQIPEQFDLLLHDDPQVQAAARRVMQRYNAKHEPWSDLYNRLVAVLDDPNRADDHLAAMRAIAALYPYLTENWPADTELLMRHHRALATGDDSLIATTLWLLTKLNGSDAQYVIARTREMLPEEFTDDRAKLARDAMKHLEAEERAIYGQ